jgi:hypothetical protein
MKFIAVKEGGNTIFRFLEDQEKPFTPLLEEIIIMEVALGLNVKHIRLNKSDAMKRAISLYHSILKKEMTNETIQQIQQQPSGNEPGHAD